MGGNISIFLFHGNRTRAETKRKRHAMAFHHNGCSDKFITSVRFLQSPAAIFSRPRSHFYFVPYYLKKDR